MKTFSFNYMMPKIKHNLSLKVRTHELELLSLMMINQVKSALLRPNRSKLLHLKKKLVWEFKEKTVVMVL